MRLYDDLAPWWSLMSPPSRYAEEAAQLLACMSGAFGRPLGSLLELGSGAGHLATHLPTSLEVVLLDRSEAMLSVSRTSNPDRAHVAADLRTARLGRTFDAVLLHDTVMYLTSREDLVSAMHTAAAHLVPGGVFLILPDVVKETFEEGTVSGGSEDAARAVQMLEWHWDPDPEDDTFAVEFAILLREHGQVRSVHEQHQMGLFDRQTLWDAVRAAGLTPIAPPDPYAAAELGEVFLARR